MRALRHFYEAYGGKLYGEMGFRDAYNLDADYFADSYLAIDQGPIIGMIENHRTGLLWDRFMANPEIATALEAAGFTRDSTTVGTAGVLAKAAFDVRPNPSSGAIQISLPDFDGAAVLEVITPLGQVGFRQNLRDARQDVDLSALPSGSYVLRVNTADGRTGTQLLQLLNGR